MQLHPTKCELSPSQSAVLGKKLLQPAYFKLLSVLHDMKVIHSVTVPCFVLILLN